MKKGVIIIFLGILFVCSIVSFGILRQKAVSSVHTLQKITSILPTTSLSLTPASLSPLSIAAMRAKNYPGSPLHIIMTLQSTAQYTPFIVSYLSDELLQYGLLTVPTGTKPAGGWPVLLFNHGYIPPGQYSTEQSYASWVDYFAQNGFIVFKPDYRGNGLSQGTPSQVYVSSDYVTDSMNALASVKQYPQANPHAIGVFGHSMGGNITLHELVISNEWKAAEIISGVVGSSSAILDWWHTRIQNNAITGNDMDTAQLITQLINNNGTPLTNPQFWQSIDPNAFLSAVSSPVQLQVGTNDAVVPPQFSQSLHTALVKEQKNVSYYEYPGADHNVSPSLSLALQRALQFFTMYLK